MNSIKIDKTDIVLAINDDKTNTISFDPLDMNFVNGVMKLLEKSKSFKDVKFESLMKMFDDLDASIDEIFGAGTVEKVFKGRRVITQYEQFLNGIVPFIQEATDKRVAKYINE